MIAEVLIPLLQERFPGKGVYAAKSPDPCATFPPIHPEVGEIQLYDDGEEITLVAGNFTHVHFSNHDDLPPTERAKIIAADVADFLEKLWEAR